MSELIEDHAYRTYDAFLTSNEATLKRLPVPAVAIKYYEYENPFLRALFCTATQPDADVRGRRAPKQLQSLYDVLVSVRDDEKEHWMTLCNLVQYDDLKGVGSAVMSTEATPHELPATEALHAHERDAHHLRLQLSEHSGYDAQPRLQLSDNSGY